MISNRIGRIASVIGVYPSGILSYRRSVVWIGYTAATGSVADGRGFLWIKRPAAKLRNPTDRSTYVMYNASGGLQNGRGPYGFDMGGRPLGGVSYRWHKRA